MLVYRSEILVYFIITETLRLVAANVGHDHTLLYRPQNLLLR